MNIAILGPQGSGKSTQARLLGQHLNLPVLDVGDFLRDVVATETTEGEMIKASMQKGELVNEDLVVSLLKKELENEKYKNGVVMDGAARTLRQAQDLVGNVDKVFYLNLQDDVAKERLLTRGRFDDTPDIIDRRLALYHKEVGPVLDYFKSIGVLETIDAAATVEEIFNKIKSRLGR